MSTKLPSYLRFRGRTIWYKRRVPERLRHLPHFNGKAVFERSLDVHTVEEARRVIVAEGIDRLFEDRSEKIVEVSDKIEVTDEILNGLMNEMYNRSAPKMYASRMSEPLEVRITRDELAAQDVGALNDDYRADRVRAILKRDQEDVRLRMAEVIANKKNLRDDSESIQLIADAIFEVEIAEMRARVDLAGNKTEPSKPHFAFGVGENIHHPKAYKTFLEMAEEAISKGKKKESWNHKVRVAAKLFNQQVKGAALHKIERTDVRSFLRIFSEAPAGMVQRFPKLGLEAAIAANAAREKPYAKISPNTINTNYFAPLRWVFAYALGEDYLKVSPCSDVRVKGASKSKGKSRGVPFEVDELNAFFSLPTFTGCRSKNHPNVAGQYCINDHRKWVPLLMLFSGARPSEIAQLLVKDIRHNSQYPSISILTDFDPSDPYDQEHVVSYKTENAKRLLPIHPRLIELGFLDYVKEMELAKSKRLFPEWKKSDDPRKLYTSASWIRNINERMIPSVVDRHPKPTLYSFRHTWKTLMATHSVPSQFQNQIMGHAQTGMDAFYMGSLGIDALYKAVESLTYDGLDLSRLQHPPLPKAKS
jgi:integrase